MTCWDFTHFRTPRMVGQKISDVVHFPVYNDPCIRGSPMIPHFLKSNDLQCGRTARQAIRDFPRRKLVSRDPSSCGSSTESGLLGRVSSPSLASSLSTAAIPLDTGGKCSERESFSPAERHSQSPPMLRTSPRATKNSASGVEIWTAKSAPDSLKWYEKAPHAQGCEHSTTGPKARSVARSSDCSSRSPGIPERSWDRDALATFPAPPLARPPLRHLTGFQEVKTASSSAEMQAASAAIISSIPSYTRGTGGAGREDSSPSTSSNRSCAGLDIQQVFRRHRHSIVKPGPQSHILWYRASSARPSSLLPMCPLVLTRPFWLNDKPGSRKIPRVPFSPNGSSVLPLIP